MTTDQGADAADARPTAPAPMPAADAAGATTNWDKTRLWGERDLLRVTDLRTYFPLKEGTIRAVDGIDLVVEAGRTLCIVGETFRCKSMTGRSIMRLIDPPGEVVSGRI